MKDRDPWYIDSGCSEHMTGKSENFISLQRKNDGTITFGDKSKGSIMGKGKVSFSTLVEIDDVNLVDNLAFNLLSVALICDQGDNEVSFTKEGCIVKNRMSNEILLKGVRRSNSYLVDMTFNPKTPLCLSSISDSSDLWYRRLGHVGIKTICKLHNNDLVLGLPKIASTSDICDACVKGKQVRTSFPIKQYISTSRPLDLIHMDLYGPMRVKSRGGNKYVFVLVDDFTRYTWTIFLPSKDLVFEEFKTLILKLENSLKVPLTSI